MLVVLSPSKTQDYSDDVVCNEYTTPELAKDTKLLVKELQKLSMPQIKKLMGVSDKLAELNYTRIQDFKNKFTPKNARQALLAFRGDVYQGFEIEDYNKRDFSFAQKHLRILSGLYGVLRPLDLMQAYRLEMKTKLSNPRGKNLYDFWRQHLTDTISQSLKKDKHRSLVNLASKEYFDAILASELEVPVTTPVFKERKNGSYRVVALFAKQARGVMGNYIVKNRVKDPADLKDFAEDGYRYQAKLSNERELVFTR